MRWFCKGTVGHFTGCSPILARTKSDERRLMASVPCQGVTSFLALQVCTVMRPGSVLVHGAAGGVGNLAVQIAKVLGAATVIGTASSRHPPSLCIEAVAPTMRLSFYRLAALAGIGPEPHRRQRR